MVPQYPGLWGNLSGLPSTLTSIFRSCCVSFFEGRRPEGKECLRSANRLKPQWNVFPCSVTHSASLSVPQTGPRGTQRCPGDWRPPSPGSRHRLRAAGSLLGCSRVGTENGHRQSENGHRHCHCLLTFSQQSQTEEEIFFFFPRRYWHSSKRGGTRWSSNTAKTGGGEEGKRVSVKDLA